MPKLFQESWFHADLSAPGQTAELSEEEAFHLGKVLRIRAGERIVVTNGMGTALLCDTEAQGNRITVTAVEVLRETPLPPRIHMVLALLKGRDIEMPVEALCELPIAAVHLVSSDHTQAYKAQDHAKLVERLRSKSLVALKQAKKTWLTRIHAPVPLGLWRSTHSGALILVHPGPDRLELPGSGDLFVLIGPEGGFSSRELQSLEDGKCFNLGLGETRIRGIHAPLLACGKLMGLGLI
ncbi:MAG: RsmE family RNA methyltransferase [Fibrobacteria bacterium]